MSVVNNTPIVSLPQDAVSLIKGEHRIYDLALAKALGFTDTHKIRNLIKRHIKALNAFGGISATVAENAETKGRGRPGRSYYLNEHQAVFLCTKSETANATALTIKLVETFVAVKHGIRQPALPRPKTLTNAQRRTIQHLIRERWPDNDERRDAYDRLKEQFDVARYWHIEKERFREAIDFILLDAPNNDPPTEVRLRLPIERPDAVFDEATRIAEVLYMVEDCSKAADVFHANARFVEEAFRDLSRNFTALHQKIKYAHAHAGEFLGPE